MIKTVLLVFLGGGIGSVCRFLVSRVMKYLEMEKIPLATFSVNVLGCLLIGILSGYFAKNTDSQSLKMFLVVGFCGGFTTFSTFANENFLLMKSNEFFLAVIYLTLSILLGLIAVWAGYKIGNCLTN